MLLDDPGAAAELYRAVQEALGAEDRRRFLSVANRLLRTRNGAEPGSSVPLFFETLDELRRTHAGTDAGPALERLAAGRGRAEAYRAGLLDGPAARIPVLNPLLPAIVATAAYWSGPGRRPVRLVHDRQNLLTPERIAWIEETARRSGVALAELRLVVARDDPRVQLADFLAGIARKAAGDALRGNGDRASPRCCVPTSIRRRCGATTVRRSRWACPCPTPRCGRAAEANTVPPALNTTGSAAVWTRGALLEGDPRGARTALSRFWSDA